MSTVNFKPMPKPEISLIAFHLSKAGIKGKSLPSVFEDSDDDMKHRQRKPIISNDDDYDDDENDNDFTDELTEIDESESNGNGEDFDENSRNENDISNEPNLSLIISKPHDSCNDNVIKNVAYSAPLESSAPMASQLTLSSSLPCVNEKNKKEPRKSKNSKPPSVWCHSIKGSKCNAIRDDGQFTKSEPNVLFNLFRTLSVSSMPALPVTQETPSNHNRKSSLGSLPIPLSASLTLPVKSFSPINFLSRRFTTSEVPISKSSTNSRKLSTSTKAESSNTIDTTLATARMIKYDAQVERRKMNEQKTVWQKFERWLEGDLDTARQLNNEILQESRYPDTLSSRLRNVKARWSLPIADARSEARMQAIELLSKARSIYRQSNNSVSISTSQQQQQQQPLMTVNGKIPRCDHCFRLHAGGPYECELNRQIRQNRSNEREKRRRKAWIEFHLTELKLHVNNWDIIDCPHSIQHIKNFEYGADNYFHVMSRKSWLEIQGDTDRERRESLLESDEFNFCLNYLSNWHAERKNKLNNQNLKNKK